MNYIKKIKILYDYYYYIIKKNQMHGADIVLANI
jgi:hypothetical protein